MSDNYISSGVKITASVDDLEKKLEYIQGKITRTISKSQKEAGVHLSLTGQLLNKQGKLVEGLTLTQVKLGQYVDEMGKVRTVEDQYVADLNKIEQALGFYADELGNVYNKQGEYIRQTAAASRATEERLKAHNEEIEATQRANDAIAASLNGFSASFGQFATLIATLKGASGEIDGFSASLIKTSQIFSTASSAFGNVSGLIKGFQNVKKSGEILFQRLNQLSSVSNKNIGGLVGTVGKLAPAFSALGGPVGMAAAGVAALGAGIATAVAMNSQTNLLSDSFKEIEKSAKKAGDSVRSLGDALHYGAFQTPVSEYDAAFDKIQKTAETLKNAREEAAKMIEGARYGGMGGGGYAAGYVGSAEIARAEAEQKNAWAEYTNVVKQMIATAREEQRTEVDKLAEQKRIFESIRDQADKNEELKKDVEARKVVEKQIEALEKKIEEAKSRETDAAIAATRRSLGIDQYLVAPAKKAGLTLEAYAETVKEWREKAKDLGLDQSELDDAIKRYKAAVDENVKAELARRLGVDFGSSGALSLNDKFKELEQAFADEKIAAEEHATGLRQLQDARARELAESADRIRDEKSVAEVEKKRAEEIARINAEFKNKRIAQKQRDELLAKVETESVATIKNLNDARREEAAREFGVDFDRAKVGSDFDEFHNRLRRLNELLHDQTVSQEQYANGLAQLKENALASLPGMTELLGATKEAATAEEKHAEVVKSLDAALEKGLLDQQRRDALLAKADERLADAKKREAEAKNAKTISELGLDAFIAAGEKEKSAREKIDEQFGKIRKAFHEGLISQEQMNKATKSRTNQLKELRRQEKEAARQAAEQRRQDMRSKLGIDSLMESLKTPLQKYRETMDEIASATKMGAISRVERAALENKAADDYWNVMRDKQTREGVDRRSKDDLAKSVSSGSAELYLSQVKNQTANYQSRIQQTTENLYKTSQEALYQSQQTNLYLQELLANSGAIGVWG